MVRKVPSKLGQKEMAESLSGSAAKLQCCPICAWSLSYSRQVYSYPEEQPRKVHKQGKKNQSQQLPG